MLKCPFCGFDNEDGALFCEQCKSDLSSVPSTPAPSAPEEVPMAALIEEPAALIDTVPLAAIEPVEAVAILPDEAIPEAILEPIAVAAEPLDVPVVEAIPVTAPIPVPEAVPEPPPPVQAPIAEVPPAAPVIAAPPAAPPAAPVVAAVAAPAAPAIPVAAAPAPAAAPAGGASLAGSQPKLKVQRGLKVGAEFPIYPDYNYIGRADEKPVDIDLEDQEPPDRVWCSRQHAVIHFDDAAGVITIEDLNSSNGTYVNRTRVYPGQKLQLKPNDVVQIGTVHLKLML